MNIWYYVDRMFVENQRNSTDSFHKQVRNKQFPKL